MNQGTETQVTQPDRSSAAYRRDLYRARLVIAQMREEALASREPFQVADLALDDAALDELWDGLDPERRREGLGAKRAAGPARSAV